MCVLDQSVVIIRQIHTVSVCTYKRAIFIGRQDVNGIMYIPLHHHVYAKCCPHVVNGIIYIPLHHMYPKCCPHVSWGGDGIYIVSINK